jgi:hypothetical protein
MSAEEDWAAEAAEILDEDEEALPPVTEAIEKLGRTVESLMELEGLFADVGARLWLAIHSAVNKHGLENTPLGPFPDVLRLPILGEEFGEVCRALTYDQDPGRLELELEDVGAVAVMWLMAKELENGKAPEGGDGAVVDGEIPGDGGSWEPAPARPSAGTPEDGRTSGRSVG